MALQNGNSLSYICISLSGVNFSAAAHVLLYYFKLNCAISDTYAIHMHTYAIHMHAYIHTYIHTGDTLIQVLDASANSSEIPEEHDEGMSRKLIEARKQFKEALMKEAEKVGGMHVCMYVCMYIY
jgi:hypothetical protein